MSGEKTMITPCLPTRPSLCFQGVMDHAPTGALMSGEKTMITPCLPTRPSLRFQNVMDHAPTGAPMSGEKTMITPLRFVAGWKDSSSCLDYGLFPFYFAQNFIGGAETIQARRHATVHGGL